MARFIELTLANQEPEAEMPKTIVLATGRIESMCQRYDKNGGWTHTSIDMASGIRFDVAHILDEIERAIATKDKITARAETEQDYV